MPLPILNCVLGEIRCLCADRQSHILCEEKLQKSVSLMTVQPAELIHIWGKRATNCNSITLRWPSTLGAINAMLVLLKVHHQKVDIAKKIAHYFLSMLMLNTAAHFQSPKPISSNPP